MRANRDTQSGGRMHTVFPHCSAHDVSVASAGQRHGATRDDFVLVGSCEVDPQLETPGLRKGILRTRALNSLHSIHSRQRLWVHTLSDPFLKGLPCLHHDPHGGRETCRVNSEIIVVERIYMGVKISFTLGSHYIITVIYSTVPHAFKLSDWQLILCF